MSAELSKQIHDVLSCICLERRIVVATGRPLEEARKSEVIDLLDPNLRCDDLPMYPLEAASAFGMLYNGNEILICGGNGQVDCYILGKDVIQTNLIMERNWAVGIALDDTKLLITGGRDIKNNSYVAGTTEIVSPGKPTISGPTLPFPSVSHCLTKINETTLFLSGGFRPEIGAENATYFYFLDTQTWIPGPDMVNVRGDHACTAYRDLKDQQVIMVAGGYQNPFNEENVRNSTEILDLSTNSWTLGKFNFITNDILKQSQTFFRP